MDLVFVSTCYSQDLAEYFKECGAKNVIYILRETEIIQDIDISFTKYFYKNLFEGKSIKQSFDKAKNEIFAELDKDYISGITFSGGDPLHPANMYDVLDLAREIREKYPNKTIWLYTGSRWKEVYELPIVKYIDVLVDGEFDVELKDVKLRWKGSSNQKVIDVQETLSSDDPLEPVIHCPDYYV